MEAEFEGKVAVLTGAARGIGAGTAELLASRGAAVALLDRNGDGVEAVAKNIEAAGGRALAQQVDLSEPEQIESSFAELLEWGGGVDILIINHTVHACGAVLDTELFEWELTFAANLTGAFMCSKLSLPSMIERGGGNVIALGSDCAIRSCRDAAAYSASKAALLGLIRSIAIDYADQNVRSNLVTPGATDTPGLRSVYSEGRDLEQSLARAAAQSPIGRLGLVEDVAEMISFACSSRATFVTGSELVVDGGMTISYSAD
jgi:NAD(P)-dependent dehydrogenase (short-subunit alcohol dehydrogenase family)